MLKKHFSILTCVVTALIVISPSTGLAADTWSQPTYTEQWSSPTITEPWSAPSTTKQEIIAPKSETTVIPNTAVTEYNRQDAKPNNSPSTYIMLQIGNKNARIQDKNIQLDVAPSVIGGRTMVPIRFLGEALNAVVDWEAKTQKVTLSLKDKTVVLTIGEPIALVNGKRVELDVPPVTKDGRTLVPLRFASENLDLFVNYINATQTIEIADQPFTNDHATTTESTKTIANQQPTNESAGKSFEETLKEPVVDFEKLYGTWYIWTPGSVTNLYDKTTGDYVTHDYDKGADQGRVIINKNGTYSMTHAAWAKGITAEGKWRLSFPAEINGERIQAVVLLNGLTSVDWAVAPSDNGKIRLLYAMRWADGSATWVFDSELYKK